MTLRVSDWVEFVYYNHRLKKWLTIKGPVVRIIHQGVLPTVGELEVFFCLVPGDKDYAAHSQTADFDRIIVMKENGNFIVIPMNPKYIHNRLFKMIMKEAL